MTSQSHPQQDFGTASPINQDKEMIDNCQRERSELLSAYVDGEVTAEERKQVQLWLDSDPKMQLLYQRLLKLRQGIQTMPIPESAVSTEQTTQQVLAKIDRRRWQRMTFGGGAIAALLVGAISVMLPGNDGFAPQLAEAPAPAKSSEKLMIALNRPVVEIPKAAYSPKSMSEAQELLKESQQNLESGSTGTEQSF